MVRRKKVKSAGSLLLPKDVEFSLLAALTGINGEGGRRDKKKKGGKGKKKKKKNGEDGEEEFRFGSLDVQFQNAFMFSQNSSHNNNNKRASSSGNNRNQLILDPVVERQRLQEMVDRKLRAIELLKGRLESLDLKHKTMEHRIMEEKKKKTERGGVQATFEQQMKVQAACKVLSGKLDRVLSRASRVETENGKLVDHINEKRKERLIFEKMQLRLKKQFEEKQKQMAELLRMSNDLNESRLKAHSDLERMLREEEEEKESVQEEHRELDDIIRKQENLQNELQTASLKRRVNQLQEQIGSGTLDPEEEAKLRARLNVLNAKIEKKSQEIESAQKETIWNFEEAFQKIIAEASQEAGRDMSLSDVVGQYVQNYDEAFSLLSYVQQVQDENFKLEAQLASRKVEFIKYSKEQGKNDMNKERIKNELQSKLEHFQQGNKKLQTSIESREATLGSLVQAIERLVVLFKDRGVSMPDHQVDVESYHKSIMQTLGQIELKTVEMCRMLQSRVVAQQQMEEERTRTRLSTIETYGGKQSKTTSFSAKPGSQPPVLDLYDGPPSPCRSRQEARVKIPKLTEVDVANIFDVKPEQRGMAALMDLDDGAEMKVVSTEELREMVQLTLAKPGNNQTPNSGRVLQGGPANGGGPNSGPVTTEKNIHHYVT